MPGLVRRQDFSPQMISHPSNLDYSLQQIPYLRPDFSFEFTNSSDRLEKTRVTPYRPAKQTSKRSAPQQSVLPVPDLNDVDALLSKPRFSADASFDPDPRFQLFEQKSVYDKLPGSYVDQPLGTLYPNALHAELNHTLAEAWRFNPVALSTRGARDTACELARTPGHGLKKEVISWVGSMGLSRAQAQSREKEADDDAAKKCLLYERYAELHGDPLGLNTTRTLQEELDDFYDPFIGEGDLSNPYDPRHRHNIPGASPPHEARPIDGTEVDKDLSGLSINTMRESLPTRRGWLGGMPAPVSTADPSKHSSVRLEHGCGAASLPTPLTGIRFAAASPSDGSTVAQDLSMISPPLTGINFASASPNYYGVMIPADLAMPSAVQLNMACSSPNIATPINQASYQNHINLASADTPTFEAKLAPLRTSKQTGKRLALFGIGEQTECGGRREGPYDFSDFCSASLDSENSDPSDGSERTVNAGRIDGAAHLHTIMLDANGKDGAASPKTPVPDADDVESASSHGTVMSDDKVISMAETLKAPAGTANHECHSHIGSMEAASTGTTSSGHTTKQTALATVEGAPNEISTPMGTPEQAKNLAQDLEQSIHSAVSQTASLALVLGQPSSLVLPKPVVAVPMPQDLQKHSDCPRDLIQTMNSQIRSELTPEYDGNMDSQTQSTNSPMQTESVRHELHQLRFNTFTTPVPKRLQNNQSAIFTKPNAINLTPEYNSVSEEDDGTSLNSLSAGVFASPTNRTQGGQTALSHFVRETSMHPSLAACDGMSMSMSISTAGSLSPEPEDMALTPTNTEFGSDDLTPNDPLEEVSLIEGSSSTTSFATPNGLEQSRGPNFASACSPYLNAFGPTSSSYYAISPPALTTPHNNTPPDQHQSTPFQISTFSRARTLVLPPTTPGTPTPAQKASDQHHSKKSSSAMLRHRNPSMDTKMRKSVKSVFESDKLGSRSPSPGKKAASDDGGNVGRKFIMENGQAMKRTMSSPAKATPAHAASSASMARTRSHDKAAHGSIGMARTDLQDQVAQAVVVSRKRKSIAKSDGVLTEEAIEGVDGEQVCKRLRRSIRTSEHVGAKSV